MKKKILLGLIAIMFGSSTLMAAGITGLEVDESQFSELHQSGLAIQIAGGGVDLAYYTDNHEYTVGFGGLTINEGVSDETMSPVIFARRNFAMTTNTTIGLGGSLGTKTGTMNEVDVEDAKYAKAYVFFEYAASKNILLGGSVTLAKFTSYTTGTTDVSEKQYLGGSNVQIAVLF